MCIGSSISNLFFRYLGCTLFRINQRLYVLCVDMGGLDWIAVHSSHVIRWTAINKTGHTLSIARGPTWPIG